MKWITALFSVLSLAAAPDSPLKLVQTIPNGVISIIGQRSADRYDRLRDVPTRDGARNALFVPELKRFYVALPGDGGSPAELRAYQDN